MIGQIIGSFKIVRFIKSGGMADVYEGQEINIGKKVAIKVLKSNFQNEKEIVNRFFKEGSVLEQLAHPNIVRVLYTTEHMGCPVMIMEYLNGEDLNDHLTNNAPLDIAIIESFFLQIVDAVIYAHSQNVLHRDIKPSNIFITQTKQIKILDFGIAKILDSNAENTQTGFGMYTPMYMSPEQARAEKNLTAHTDIYSLGVTLYTIAAGTNPYQGLSQFEVGNKVLNEPLPRLTNFSDALNKVIAKATEKNKEQRYETVKAFKDDFGRALHVKVNENVVIEKVKSEPPAKLPNNELDKQSKSDEGTNFNLYKRISGVFSFFILLFLVYNFLNKGEADPNQAAVNNTNNVAEENISNKFDEVSKNGKAYLEANKHKQGVITTSSGLQYKVIKMGTGARPTLYDKVTAHYHGTLIDGTVFDSSVDRGQPVLFPVDGVIEGWKEALLLMPIGSKWIVFLPSNLAYGERGAGGKIGPNATLIFEIELISIDK